MKKDENIYRTIVENIGQDVFISDGDGNILFVNPASIEINTLDAKHVIGRNVADLVKEGYFSDSSTLKAIDSGKQVSILLTNKNGKKFISSSTPIYNDDGTISFIISTSHDVEAMNSLFDKLDIQGAQIESLRHELSERLSSSSAGEAGTSLANLVSKAASLDSPLLITGEPGTGKHTVARKIHQRSIRKDKPMITINCSTSTPDALDAEIFGTETTLSNAKHITKGSLEFAGSGTVILNEIETMPLKVQTKLLGYLETGTFMRFGGSAPVKGEARVIAISTADMRKKAMTGGFRRDLYYTLNSLPIHVPPLRERSADIPCLARGYLSKCNSKYKDRKIIPSGSMAILMSHNWPGNTLELARAVESAYILTDGHMITAETIYGIIHGPESQAKDKKVYCTDIIPLKEAKKQLEEDLVKRAIEVYGTTYKAAEVLKIDQSTVSKIMKKYR